MKKLLITYVSISDIKPYKNNPKIHKAKQVTQIGSSIKEFSFTNPILLDENNEVLAGHGRYLAAKELKLEIAPCIILDYLSNQQKKAYRIADNKLVENGKWDENLLGLELADLSNLDLSFDLSITGFETTEIDLLIDRQSKQNQKEDKIPEITANLVSKLGDVWLLDKHRIICGDSLKAATYEKLSPDSNKKAQMIFTDPPYNVAITGHVCGVGKIKHREFAMASGEMTTSEFTNFLTSVFQNLKTFSTDGSLHYVCMDWRHMKELLDSGLSVYDEIKNLCVWNKDNGGMGSLYRSKHELVFIFKNGKESHVNNVELGKNGRYRTNVWDYAGVNSFGGNQEDLKLHPTVKPVAMIVDAILDVTKRNDIVLDSFLGSGSTLIACEKTGRICYGIELDPIYVDTIIKRWQEYSGKEAIHEESGKTFNEINKEPVNNSEINDNQYVQQ
jgi:DNA modification methylase